MQVFDETDCSTGVYRCSGSLADMQILVELEETMPWLGENIEQNENIHGNFLNESRRFYWQEKVLSNIESRITEKGSQTPNTFFTFVASDTEQLRALEEHRSKEFLPQNKIYKLTKRRPALPQVPTKNIITFYGHSDSLPNEQYECMYILTDMDTLFRVNAYNSKYCNLYIIVELIYDKERGKLTVFPDLNGEKATGKPGYIIKPIGAGRTQFVYWVSIFQDSYTKEKLEVCQPLKIQHFPKFDIPQYGNIEVHILGRIISCNGFSSNFQIVNYNFFLPEGWKSINKSSLSGNTQTSITIEGVSTFQHLVNVHLSLKLPYPGTSRGNISESMEILWPQLVLKVISKNFWGRVSVDGCTTITIPSKPGHHRYKLTTYRPALNNINLLKKFFIGVSPYMDNLSCTTFHNKHSVYEKTGLQTSTSGEISMELAIIHQFQPNIFTKTETETDGLRHSIAPNMDAVLNLLRC